MLYLKLISWFLFRSTFFELICAAIQIKNDSVIEFAVVITTINAERDFKSEYLFRMFSFATDLVTSLEISPIRCATTLCNLGRTRNSYVTTFFIRLSSTAESSSTSGYVVVSERFDQNAEATSRYEERARKNLSFVPCSGFNRCKMLTHVNIELFQSFVCI